MDKDRVYLGIELNKNLLWTIVLGLIWITASFFFVSMLPPPNVLTLTALTLIAGICFIPAAFITYQLVRGMRGVDQPVKTTGESSRSQRVQNWLNSLDDDELDALRDRLQEDVPERTLEELVSKPKRNTR